MARRPLHSQRPLPSGACVWLRGRAQFRCCLAAPAVPTLPAQHIKVEKLHIFPLFRAPGVAPPARPRARPSHLHICLWITSAISNCVQHFAHMQRLTTPGPFLRPQPPLRTCCSTLAREAQQGGGRCALPRRRLNQTRLQCASVMCYRSLAAASGSPALQCPPSQVLLLRTFVPFRPSWKLQAIANYSRRDFAWLRLDVWLWAVTVDDELASRIQGAQGDVGRLARGAGEVEIW
jgi:hypothetical protein